MGKLIVTTTSANSPTLAFPPQQPPLSGGKRLRGMVAENTAEHPLVTVITAVFNARPYISGCLDSVIGQDYPNVEHIVLDGGSSDGTAEQHHEFNARIVLRNHAPHNA